MQKRRRLRISNTPNLMLGYRQYGQKGKYKMEFKIHPKDFSNFLRCLSLLQDDCNDADIREGILRQRKNLKENITEMDLTPLVSDCDIVLSNLRQKLPLLKGLSGQEVKINSTGNEISFSGERSIFKFVNPRVDYLDNKFMSSQELANIFTLKEKDVILEYAVSKETSKLMKVIQRQFHVISFQICFEGDNASIVSTTTNKDQYSEIECGIPLKRPLKCFSNIIATPFFIDHDGEILFKIYNVQDTLCVDKFKTLVGKISVIFYGKSHLIEEIVEEEP